MAASRSVRKQATTPRIARILPPEDLGKLGELKFESLCIEAGLTANKSTMDETGWDYLVEFPYPNSLDGVRLESRVSPPSALVQVKTKLITSANFKIKLSNCERLAKWPGLSMICVLDVRPDKTFERMYFLPVIGETLSRILMQLRKAESTNSLLINRKFLYLDPKAHAVPLVLDNNILRSAIIDAGGSDPHAYIETKRKERLNLGYNGAPISGSFTLIARSKEDVADVMLGLRVGEVHNLQIREHRWGITLPVFETEEPAKVRFSPSPRKGTITFKSEIDRIELDVNVYAVPVGERQAASWRFRMTSDLVEMMFDTASGRLSLENNYANDRPRTVRDHLRCSRVQKIIITEVSHVEIKVEGRTVTKGFLTGDQSVVTSKQIDGWIMTLRHLELVLDKIDASNLPVSVGEINAESEKTEVIFSILQRTGTGMRAIFEFLEHAEMVIPTGVLNIVLFCFLLYGGKCIATASVGTGAIEVTRSKSLIELAELRAREIEILDHNRDEVDGFIERIKGETGIQFHIVIGAV